MTLVSKGAVGLPAALGAALVLSNFTQVHAQCATCVTPTVAYSPVVAQPAVVTPTIVRTGWYPGYWIDRMRLNRWSRSAVATAPTYTTGYAPVYTAAYAPTYTAAYAPAITHTAAFTPYLTSYAPLQQPVVQTSYSPAATSACCPQSSPTAVITTSYAPSTVYRPVEVQPIVDTVAAAPCSSCPSCPTSVSQAIYSEAAPASTGCAGCAESGSGPNFTFGTESAAQGSTTQGSASQGSTSGLEQPTLAPHEPAPTGANYGGSSPGSTGAAGSANAAQESTDGGAVPGPGPDDGAASEPGPGAEAKPNDSSTFYFPEAPQLLSPQNDRTAHRPTVDVHNAVYRRPVRNANVSTTTAKPATSSAPTSNAGGWYSISER